MKETISRLRCDWCGHTGPEGQNTTAATARAEKIGWKLLGPIGDAMHKCPNCADADAYQRRIAGLRAERDQPGATPR